MFPKKVSGLLRNGPHQCYRCLQQRMIDHNTVEECTSFVRSIEVQWEEAYGLSFVSDILQLNTLIKYFVLSFLRPHNYSKHYFSAKVQVYNLSQSVLMLNQLSILLTEITFTITFTVQGLLLFEGWFCFQVPTEHSFIQVTASSTFWTI